MTRETQKYEKTPKGFWPHCWLLIQNEVQAKSLYKSCAGRHFYWTENEIWAGFGPVGNTGKKVGVNYDNFWGQFFHVFKGIFFFFLNIVVYRGLILCSKKKILAVESRDLSQTDTILNIGSSLVSLSSLLRPELSAKWILSILSDLPLTRETETNVYCFNFTKVQFLNDKLYSNTKTSYLAKLLFWSILSFKNWKVNICLSFSGGR